jgi:hypothetical protein
MSLEPRIDPLSFQTDRSPPADACVVQLTALAGSVDRVAANAGILRALGNGQPGLHGPSRAPAFERGKNCCGVCGALERVDHSPTRCFSGADAGNLPTSGRGSIAPRGVGDDSGIAF